MTLDLLHSRIYVVDPVGLGEIYGVCVTALVDAEGYGRAPAEINCLNRRTTSAGTARTLETRPGQQLPACMRINYQPDGPYRTAEETVRDGDPDPACHLEVTFETATAWIGPHGETPEVLHVRLVTVIGHVLDDMKVRWLWLNQSTGRIHTGYRDLVLLGLPGVVK